MSKTRPGSARSRKNPLVSFCISTYKRPQFIVNTVKKVLQQTYDNFEIIICDNNPDSTLKPKLAKLKSKKIHYHKNPKNLGMVPSFNKAFRFSKGEFIVFMSDDDPPYPFMLEELVNLSKLHPECVAYFGAYDLYTPDAQLAHHTSLPMGYLSCRNQEWPLGAVKVFSPRAYLTKALNQEIFYYLMWSTGIVRRKVVEQVGAIPEYGSPLMTDRSYCVKVGTAGKVLIYNKELAAQTVHQRSFSLTSSGADVLVTGFINYYHDMLPFLKRFNVRKEHEAFVLRHVMNMFMIVKVSDEMHQRPTDAKTLMGFFDQIASELQFLKPYRWQLSLMLWQRFPFEILFKAIQMPPQKLAKSAFHFVRFRLLSFLHLA